MCRACSSSMPKEKNRGKCRSRRRSKPRARLGSISSRSRRNSVPPVCKILDYGKFRFEEQKKKAETRKKAKRIELKEIKVRPNIDDHDYEVKMRAIHRFFEEGDKVKVTLRFRGREMAHTHLGMELLERMRTELDKIAKVEHEPRFEGRQVVMVMAPRG